MHNAIHSNMCIVISVNANNCYNKMNAKVLEIANGQLLPEQHTHVNPWHVLIILSNNNVLK